ncbi:MAG: hypothetical protein JRJ00_14760 [Deltaproteobacteria bacterium]|nr:hypothetical protein [Deltaproteobacteria bacterium]
MTILEIRQIFDQSLDLSPGESITIHCDDSKEQNYIRVSLYRERTKFNEANPTKRANLQISRATDGKTPTITIAVSKDISAKLITKKTTNGNLEMITLDTLKVKEESENNRIKELMLADGYTEEEIISLLSK